MGPRSCPLGQFPAVIALARGVSCRRSPVRHRRLENRALEPEQMLLALEPAAVAGEAARRTDTRWHGSTIGTGFRFITVPTARAAWGPAGPRARRTSS